MNTVPVDVTDFTNAELAALHSSLLRTNRSLVYNTDNSRLEMWNGSAWVAAGSGGGSVDDASETVKGIVQFATDTEVAGSGSDLAISPYRMREYFGTVGVAVVYGTTITGDGSKTLWETITAPVGGNLLIHSIIMLTDLATGYQVPTSEVSIKKYSDSTFDIEFVTAPASGNSYGVTIFGKY